MSIRVLVVEDDLNVHKVIDDILEVVYRDLKIDKALTTESLLGKIKQNDTTYDLVLFDIHFEEPAGRDLLLKLRTERPDLNQKIVILNGSYEGISTDQDLKGLPVILRPFSIDKFSETITNICAA